MHQKLFKKEKLHHWIKWYQYQHTILEEHSALPAVYPTVHMCNLNAACVHRQFSSLRGMSLNSADKSFLPSSPPKTFNHQKEGKTISSPYLFLLLHLPHPNSPFCLLRNNRSESTPTPFLSLRWHSRTMWSPPIQTAQRRPASNCVKQRDGQMTKVGANILLYIGGAIVEGMLSQTGPVLLMIRHNLVSSKHGSWGRLTTFL